MFVFSQSLIIMNSKAKQTEESGKWQILLSDKARYHVKGNY